VGAKGLADGLKEKDFALAFSFDILRLDFFASTVVVEDTTLVVEQELILSENTFSSLLISTVAISSSFEV